VAAFADCILVAGTSATVYPAAQFPFQIHERGGTLIEVNPYPSELTALCTHSLRAPAGEALPRLLDRVRDLRG
jgi:NAD-dependent deacetylase